MLGIYLAIEVMIPPSGRGQPVGWFAPEYKYADEAAGLHPSHVSLELTEGMLMRRPEQVIPVMARLRQAGFASCIDTEECIVQHLQAMQAQRYLPL